MGWKKIFLCILFMHGEVWANDNLWYEMSFPWDAALPYPVNMSSRVLDAPSGKHGYVKSVKDRLEFEDGTVARFWGVVMAVSTSTGDGSLPPIKEDAGKIAKKIASYGFNHVRIVGFDGHAHQALEQWKKTGEVKSKQIDKLDYFISELRKHGVYYSFSINNSSSALFKGEHNVLPNDGEPMPYKKYRNTRMFFDDATDLMVNWTRAFYSRKNPYTGLTYAQDPANIYVSAVNEDTANIVRFNKGRTLSAQWKRRINDLFNEFLHDKYKSEKNLNTAWSTSLVPVLIIGESYKKKNIDLFTSLSYLLLPRQRISDMFEFLIERDIRYTRKIRNMLDSIGYKGLITGTNKWYGLGSLYSNYRTGSYINGHDYFGGLENIKREKGDIASARLLNKDYLGLLYADPSMALDDTRFALSRILPAHLTDRPYITSEWNQVIWGDYAYQGPFIISSYAALNGIDGLDVHMLYNHPRPSYKDEYPRNALAVSSNPLLTALMPTLSLAYIRGDIHEHEKKIVYCYAKDMEEMKSIWHRRPQVPDELKELFKKYPYGSVRVGMLEGCDDKQRMLSESSINHEAIKIGSSEHGKASLTINTEKYVARVGDMSLGVKLGPLEVNLEQLGSISLISLDDLPLQTSECALLTIVGPTKNKGMKIEYRNGKKVIGDLGKWPPLLRGNKGVIKINMQKNKEYSVMPLIMHNKQTDVDVMKFDGEISVSLEQQKTPWYLITSNGCDQRHVTID